MSKIELKFGRVEILAAEDLAGWRKTLVVAPHPDDESLGCGGAVALLRQLNIPVIVLTMTDGTLSHPNSVKFPVEKLRELRETEMRNALAALGVGEENVTFLRFPDRRLPSETSPKFAEATEKVKLFLETHQPQTILVPWRRDPHPDHQAAWQIFNHINEIFDRRFRLLEYPIWLWEMAEADDLPDNQNFVAHRLNIESVTEVKQRAIRAHVSQISDLIDDDPAGFRLSPEVLAHFVHPFEIYLEEIK